MPKSLFHALLFHFILQNIYIWIWLGGGVGGGRRVERENFSVLPNSWRFLIFSLLYQTNSLQGQEFFISLFPLSLPYCWHLMRDLWASLGCVSESDNWISQGASYWEDRFVLLCGTPFVADLLCLFLPVHPHPLSGWVTAENFTSKYKRMSSHRAIH